MSSPTEFEEFTNKFMTLGENEVRKKLLQNVYAGKHKDWAEAWLKSEEQKRTSVSEGRAEAREEEALAIAREANEIARSARTVSLVAAGAAIVAAVAAIVTINW
jgi:Na+(H+)/acetate symporter ActP